jgi:hypothetical protein
MGMDPMLADYFGTNKDAPEPTAQEDELEKMAQLVLLDEVAKERNVDLSKLSDEDCVKLASEMFQAGYEPQEEVASNLSDEEQTAVGVLKEAEFFGATAAHSLWNELAAIQKCAEEKAAARGRVMHMPYDSEVVSAGSGRALAKVKKPGTTALMQIGKKGLSTKGKILAGLAAGGLAAGAGTAAGLLAKKKKDKDKEASALGTLADARAFEILKQHGLADDAGNVVSPDQLNKHAQEEEKTAADKLAEAVELEAWKKLQELGYPIVEQE